MKITGSITVKPPAQIIKEHGLDKNGNVQRFHTQNAIRRIQKYMPNRTGMTIDLMVAQSPIDEPLVRIDVPYARYLYYGKVMVGPAPKTVTNIDLHYTTTKNPQAGPYWDRRLLASEKEAMRQDLQNYVDRRET
jgi:hypothetical protein